MFETKFLIRDEIHGDIQFNDLVRRAINHSDFQRLRYIKQLGLAEYVFPCANHTRFQHSLGAAHLAGTYFLQMLKYWNDFSLNVSETTVDGNTLLLAKTKDVFVSVRNDPKSTQFWWEAISLAALLHDVGHGPWSHTFEQLKLPQDFSDELKALPPEVVSFLEESSEKKGIYFHEELSLLYLRKVLENVCTEGRCKELFFLAVGLLLHSGLQKSPEAKKLEARLEKFLDEKGIKGGLLLHRLLRPIISGPFDVDRIDYIQRDGRNCGVLIGGIEWRRIITKVAPCLVIAKNGKEETCLISSIKNQHVLDDFVFSLFQMYAQVYLHPKIIGFEEMIKRELHKKPDVWKDHLITLDLHRSFSDEAFVKWLGENLGSNDIPEILHRADHKQFAAESLPRNSNIDESFDRSELVHTDERPMLKDVLNVFLYGNIPGSNRAFFQPWSSVSPIANQFFSVSHSPHVWLKTL